MESTHKPETYSYSKRSKRKNDGYMLKGHRSPDQWLSWLERCPVNQKVVGFDSWSGYIPRLQVRSLVEVCTGGN